MIVAKGYAVTLTLEDGQKLRGPALLHDESGKDWPSCSSLVAAFRKTQEHLKDVRGYFGAVYQVRRGELQLPPRDLSAWTRVGAATEITYSRHGEHADDYYHPFGEKSALPIVYRRGGVLRIELGRGCKWNWRGIIRP